MTLSRPSSRDLSLLALLALACSPPDAGRPDFRLRAYARVVAAEDTRHVAGESFELLQAATRSPDPFIRATGVRALGRLEAPEMVGHITPTLEDESALVRAEAANALAQAVHRQPGDVALGPLLARVEEERHPRVLAVLARSLGRLSLPESARHRVARALVALSRDSDGGPPPPPQAEGVAQGMRSFVVGDRSTPTPAALVERLRELATYRAVGRQTPEAIHTRTVAVTALNATGHMTAVDVERSLRDPSESVRRAAAANAGALPLSVRAEFIRRILVDPSPQVRYEGVRALGGQPLDPLSCGRLTTVVREEVSAMVRVGALNALGRPCPDVATQTALLDSVAARLTDAGSRWHEPAHALTALAALAPSRAQAHLGDFAGHANPFVRAYAARAASTLRSTGALEGLAQDPDANVQTLALQGLAAVRGRAVDRLLIDVVTTADDPQVLLTAAGLLEGTALRDEAAAAALATLERLTALRRQTLWDPRGALLRLLGRVGDPRLASEVEPYIRDSERRIAELASDILMAWTGDRYIAAPRMPQRLAVPTAEELEALMHTDVVFHMTNERSFTIRMQPTWAATNAHRFVRLSQAGTFDGLTLHRVVPNFIVQGGSPGANEYAGHGAYTRDELGLTGQWRGTVGLSTRGRDTGDGQFYINLVVNPRLDHDYTLFGNVIEGMDVVDRIMEGDVIDRVEVRIAR